MIIPVEMYQCVCDGCGKRYVDEFNGFTAWGDKNMARDAAIAYDINKTEVIVEVGNYWSNMTLSFPTKEMAEDFLNCFRDLCETAKILL